MTRVRLVVGISFGTILFLLACHKDSRTIKHVLDTPVEASQQALAMGAIHKMRGDWNAGACRSIYDQSAQFFRSQTAEEWMNQCAQLREDLGTWQSFTPSPAVRCASPELVICLVGSAVFAKESKGLELAWSLQNQEARLFWLSVQQNHDYWLQIPFQQNNFRFMDPPVPPPSRVRAGWKSESLKTFEGVLTQMRIRRNE